jgi:hypothetical protein
MKITIDFKTENAAFQDNDQEWIEIVEKAVHLLKFGERNGYLRDSNGNQVGFFKVTGN